MYNTYEGFFSKQNISFKILPPSPLLRWGFKFTWDVFIISLPNNSYSLKHEKPLKTETLYRNSNSQEQVSIFTHSKGAEVLTAFPRAPSWGYNILFSVTWPVSVTRETYFGTQGMAGCDNGQKSRCWLGWQGCFSIYRLTVNEGGEGNSTTASFKELHQSHPKVVQNIKS